MLMAKLFQEIKRHRQKEFELTFLVMDPGYSPANRARIEQNAALLHELGFEIEAFGEDFCMTNLVFPSSPYNTLKLYGNLKADVTLYPIAK